MKKSLKNIADIFTGVTYNKNLITSTKDYVAMLQVKDFNNSEFNKDSTIKIDFKYIDPRFILSKGDVILASKGSRNYAVHFSDVLGKATASSAFFIIRIKSNEIIPEFLSWYLNSKSSQTYFKSNLLGTYIPSLTKKIITDLEIPIPSIDMQRAILKIDNWQKLEKNLIEQILTKRTIFINEIIKRKLNSQNE